MAIVSLLLHLQIKLIQTEVSLFFLFLVFKQIYQTVKLLFADLKFELCNIINRTLFSIITSGSYSVYESCLV